MVSGGLLVVCDVPVVVLTCWGAVITTGAIRSRSVRVAVAESKSREEPPWVLLHNPEHLCVQHPYEFVSQVTG